MNYYMVALVAFVGMLTHVLMKMKDEQTSLGVKMNLAMLKQFVADYLVNNLLSLIVLLLVLAGWLFLLDQLAELSMVNAYLSGYAGNSLATRTDSIAKSYIDRTGPKP